jgi:hypothetical protein
MGRAARLKKERRKLGGVSKPEPEFQADQEAKCFLRDLNIELFTKSSDIDDRMDAWVQRRFTRLPKHQSEELAQAVATAVVENSRLPDEAKEFLLCVIFPYLPVK